MANRLSAEEVSQALGELLGGEVVGLRRLSGGASRVTSSFDLRVGGGAADTVRPLIFQQDRGGGAAQAGRVLVEQALLLAAREAGVPVPDVVACAPHEQLGSAWLVVERLEGETIPRKILRDPEWAEARRALTGQCGRALAAIHSIEPSSIPGLEPKDPLRHPLNFLDLLGEVRPALEYGARWLEANRPAAGPPVTVHGDFRSGNLLVGPDGLRGVLDWELAHGGDAAEDIGWLCAPAWRFGGPGPVGGFGEIDELLAAYTGAEGEAMDPARVHWWQVYATVKWATICALQASTHLSGATRSVELVAIGRRICESEWDLFVLLGLAPEAATAGAGTAESAESAPAVLAPFGRPTAAELVEAVSEYLERGPMEQGEGGGQFEARIARNVLRTVQRQLELGPALAEAHRARLAGLGFEDDQGLAAALRSGALDAVAPWNEVGRALAEAARDQLLVNNPAYVPAASG